MHEGNLWVDKLLCFASHLGRPVTVLSGEWSLIFFNCVFPFSKMCPLPSSPVFVVCVRVRIFVYVYVCDCVYDTRTFAILFSMIWQKGTPQRRQRRPHANFVLFYNIYICDTFPLTTSTMGIATEDDRKLRKPWKTYFDPQKNHVW